MKSILYFTILIIFVLGKPAMGQSITQSQAKLLSRSLEKGIDDTARIHTLLKLAEYNVFKKGENKIDFDSASVFINKAKQLKRKSSSLFVEGYTSLVESYLLREKKQILPATLLIDKAITILIKTNNYYDLGEAYYQRATYYDWGNDSQRIIAAGVFEKGLNAFKKVNAIERQAYGYKRLAEYDDDPKSALKKLFISLKLYKSIKYAALQEVYDLIAVNYKADFNLQKALPYGLLALKTAELNNDTTLQLCAINNHLGIFFYRSHEFKKAALYFTEALRTAKNYNDLNSIYQLGSNIVNSYNKTDNPLAGKKILEQIVSQYKVPETNVSLVRLMSSSFITLYTTLKLVKPGLPYVKLLEKADNSNSSSISNIQLLGDNSVIAQYYFMAKEYDLSRKFVLKNAETLKKAGTADQRFALRTMLFRLDTAQRNFEGAVSNLIAANDLKDTIANASKAIEFQKQQVQYEAEKKDQQIKILLQKDLIQQSKLERSNIIKNITIAGIVVMILICFLIYRIYKQKQSANAIITQKNELLQQLLTGKEWLLKEIHHRVKNNLHTVICLLESQARYLENDALNAIETSQQRIYAMSLIHQKLYQSEDIKTINMAEYIPELVNSLEQSFDSGSQVRFVLEIENIELELSHAIPLALIINEAVTNSIKYAFPGRRTGEVFVSLTYNAGLTKLEIIDNGIGFPNNSDDSVPESLGLKLIKGLSDDIHATFNIETVNGTKITIFFINDQVSHDDAQVYHASFA